MTCYHPIPCYWHKYRKTKIGTPDITFNPLESDPDLPEFAIPCGQCIGCRLDRSVDSAVRAHHESQLWEHNCFITLTYDNEHLPLYNSLMPPDLTKFWKRLRKRRPGERIRYMACGEYGTNYSRPHYHAILFNCEFPDQSPFSRTKTGFINYVSAELRDLWRFGFHTINNVSFETCAYVARYVTKKITGGDDRLFYTYLDQDTGEYITRYKEFSRWSSKPGIGADYFRRYWRDFIRLDRCVVNGKKFPIPRYYDKLLASEHPEEFAILKAKRLVNSEVYKLTPDATMGRLAVREQVKELKAAKLFRPFEAALKDY